MFHEHGIQHQLHIQCTVGYKHLVCMMSSPFCGRYCYQTPDLLLHYSI